MSKDKRSGVRGKGLRINVKGSLEAFEALDLTGFRNL